MNPQHFAFRKSCLVLVCAALSAATNVLGEGAFPVDPGAQGAYAPNGQPGLDPNLQVDPGGAAQDSEAASAEEASQAAAEPQQTVELPNSGVAAPKEEVFDFENEEAYMDVPDALRSKQFVHRAILSTIIRDTAKVQLGGLYVNYLMGFNAVYHPARPDQVFAKFASGMVGLSVGYSTQSGHAAEVGFELSGVSTLNFSYRYFLRMENWTVWPFAGIGLGSEITSLRLSDIPLEATLYNGSTQAFFATVGAIVPLVDIAVKAEARFNFFGSDRLMLSTALGAVFYL